MGKLYWFDSIAIKLTILDYTSLLLCAFKQSVSGIFKAADAAVEKQWFQLMKHTHTVASALTVCEGLPEVAK